MKLSEDQAIHFLILGPLIGVIIGLFMDNVGLGIPIGLVIGTTGYILFSDEES